MIIHDGKLHELVLIVAGHQVAVSNSSQVVEGSISQVGLAEEVCNEILNDSPGVRHHLDIPHISLHDSSPSVKGPQIGWEEPLDRSQDFCRCPAIVNAVLEAIVGIGNEACNLVTAPTELDQLDDFLEGVHGMASRAAGWASGELELGGTVSGSDIGLVLALGRKLEDSSGGHDDESNDDLIECGD